MKRYHVVRYEYDYEQQWRKVKMVTKDRREALDYCEYLNLMVMFKPTEEDKCWLQVEYEVEEYSPTAKVEYNKIELEQLRNRKKNEDKKRAARERRRQAAAEEAHQEWVERLRNNPVEIKKYPFIREEHQQKSFTLYDTNVEEVHEFFEEALREAESE